MLPKKYLVKAEGNSTGTFYFQKKYGKYLGYNLSREYFGEDENGYVETTYKEMFLPFFKEYRILSYNQFKEMLEESLKMTAEKEVWKKGDIIYSENYNMYRKVHLCLDDVVFTTEAEDKISDLDDDTVIINVKSNLIAKRYNLYNPKENKTTELTLEEIAKKFNVDVKDLKIKK